MLRTPFAAVLGASIQFASFALAGPVETALEREIELAFVNTPLSDVVEFVSESIQVPVELRARDKRNVLVTIKEKRIKAKDGLAKILAPHDLEYKVSEDGQKLLVVPKSKP